MHTVDDYSSPPLHAYVLDLIIADCQQILNTSCAEGAAHLL